MQLQSANWLALGSSVVGTSHIARSAVCDDAHFGVVLDDGTMLLAIGDGAGSAARSAEGALCAVHTTVQFLANRLADGQPHDSSGWEQLLHSTMAYAREQIEERANEAEDATLRDFATTILLVAATETHIATLQVGDGAIVLRLTSGQLEVLSPRPTGEYINETTFLTSEHSHREALVTTRGEGEVDAFAMFTDGVEFLAIDVATNSAHLPFFAPLFAFAGEADADPGELTSLLASDRVNELTDDDKTLVLAVRNRHSGTA